MEIQKIRHKIKNDAEIEMDRLLEENIRFVSLLDEYIEKEIDAETEFNKAKENLNILKEELELAEAEADLFLRKTKEKQTETQIKNKIKLSKKVQEKKYEIRTARKKIIEKQDAYNWYHGRVSLMTSKKKSLENLTTLLTFVYNGNPANSAKTKSKRREIENKNLEERNNKQRRKKLKDRIIKRKQEQEKTQEKRNNAIENDEMLNF